MHTAILRQLNAAGTARLDALIVILKVDSIKRSVDGIMPNIGIAFRNIKVILAERTPGGAFRVGRGDADSGKPVRAR